MPETATARILRNVQWIPSWAMDMTPSGVKIESLPAALPRHLASGVLCVQPVNALDGDFFRHRQCADKGCWQLQRVHAAEWQAGAFA